MDPITRAFWTAKGVGWDNLPRRLWQAIRVRSGILYRRTAPERYGNDAFSRSCPQTLADQTALWQARRERFLPIPDASLLAALNSPEDWQRHVVTVCEQALRGQYPFFSHWSAQLGWPPDFNLDPVHDIAWPTGEHWTGTTRSGPPRDDIKLVWESNRLTLCYFFTRAYRYDGNERWSQALWDLLDAWFAQNPAQLTVAWGCGQEIAFRLMAMLTGAMATLDSPHATPERLYALTHFAWQAGQRIESNINYAIAQKNNHALSEALGLWTVGLLFPEFPRAGRWRSMASHILQRECRRQIYRDGSFVQHSLSYHRVMLDDLMWCMQLGKANSVSLPKVVLDRFTRATDWLAQMTDPATGRVPNYGSNDGANVLPLACADYLDYRPTLQAAHWMAYGTRCLASGPWDEKLAWLVGPQACRSRVQPIDRPGRWSANDGGYYILRKPDYWLMTRCGTYRDRPHQADMLHVDLWYQGHNLLRDGGSYAYYHRDEAWNHYFHSTAAHNTVQIDGHDQMVKGPRFLWFCWPKANVIATSNPDELRLSNASYRWLKPSVHHERLITCTENAVTIHDTLTGNGRHDACLRWRLINTDWVPLAGSPATWQGQLGNTNILISVDGPATLATELVSGQTNPPEGWESLYYGEKQPSPTIIARVSFSSKLELTTTIRFSSD